MKQPEEKPGTTFVQPSVPEKGIIMSLLDFLHCSCVSSSVCSLFSTKISKPNLFCEFGMLPYQICVKFLWCHDILKNLKTRSLLRKKSYLSRWQGKKNNPHPKVLSAMCFQCVYC